MTDPTADPVRICLFAKPPLPGDVKTRLAPFIGAEGAARLAEAFLLDTCDTLSAIADAELILATTAPFPDTFPLPPGMPQWLQGQGDLGARQESILARGLRDRHRVIAIGADLPGLPRGYVEEAARLLHTHDAVLGPTRDGGYYLLGLTRHVPGLLDGLPWSVASTFAATRSRLESLGYDVAFLPEWWDVDDGEDLVVLEQWLAGHPTRAPHTAEALAQWGTRAREQSLPRTEPHNNPRADGGKP